MGGGGADPEKGGPADDLRKEVPHPASRERLMALTGQLGAVAWIKAALSPLSNRGQLTH